MKKRFLHAKALALLCTVLFSQNLVAQNTAWSTTANIGIGTTTVPTGTTKLNITSGTAGVSGLRFGNVTSGTSTLANSSGKLLTLNANGDVILANALTSIGLTMPAGFTVTGGPVTTTGTFAVTTTLNGLIRGNGSGFVASTVATSDIANSAVTYAKIQNVTSGRLLGRAAAGVGVAQEISIGSGLSLSVGGVLTGANIYNSNGTITGSRIVSYDASVYDGIEFRDLSDPSNKLSLGGGGATSILCQEGVIINGGGASVSQTAEVINITSTSSAINLQGGWGGINATTAAAITFNASDNITNSALQMSPASTYLMAPIVGIGTSTPNVNAKLTVSGNIYCTSKMLVGTADLAKVGNYSLAVNGDALFNRVRVKLYANWPDYVFDKNYQLLPLDKLEQFIQKEKHLPGVTPAAEAETEGIDIATTQQQLLKKIEELTLYIIEQDKKREAQDKKLEALEKEFKTSNR